MLPMEKSVIFTGACAKACAKRWSGVLKTPGWSVVYDFSVDVFCKLGIDK
jgi:hypothetical protein